jgi:hypothetical protein
MGLFSSPEALRLPNISETRLSFRSGDAGLPFILAEFLRVGERENETK